MCCVAPAPDTYPHPIEVDIPWPKCNKSLASEIADVVESFCAVARVCAKKQESL
jgi:hypothetical protein